MKELLKKIKDAKKSSIKKTIDKRMNEFKKVGKSSTQKIYNELCFCLLTANFNAKRAIKIQKEIGNNFSIFSEKKLAKKLKELGHRYPNARANYIFNSRKLKNIIKKKVYSFKDEKELREWIVKNVKGLGHKEASHFLRNIGFENCAIIDFHIIDILADNNLIEKPKIMTKKKYLEAEKVLETIGKKVSLNQGELDLYLWYFETGTILK